MWFGNVVKAEITFSLRSNTYHFRTQCIHFILHFIHWKVSVTVGKFPPISRYADLHTNTHTYTESCEYRYEYVSGAVSSTLNLQSKMDFCFTRGYVFLLSSHCERIRGFKSLQSRWRLMNISIFNVYCECFAMHAPATCRCWSENVNCDLKLFEWRY